MVQQISASEAFKILSEDQTAILVDVRTQQEWQQGVPKIAKSVFLSWRFRPDMDINAEFTDILQNEVPDLTTNIFFLCAAGARSFESAVIFEDLGYRNCYNIIDGFNGNKFGIGWQNNNLPWENIDVK